MIPAAYAQRVLSDLVAEIVAGTVLVMRVNLTVAADGTDFHISVKPQPPEKKPA